MQITIDLPEALQQTLIHQAAQIKTTPEQLIIRVLNQYLQPTTATADTDQLLFLIGTLDIGTTDLAENHDQYLGEALFQEPSRWIYIARAKQQHRVSVWQTDCDRLTKHTRAKGDRSLAFSGLYFVARRRS